MGNGQLVCAVCHQSFYTLGRLEKHDDTNEIRICSHSGCDSRFRSCRRLRGHLTTPHLPGHHAVWDDSAITCAECNGTFDDESKLRGHAKRENHSCYACSCGVSFARNDVLIRHLNGFTKNGAKYQCTFCRRHRGKQAFSRRDHLVQHLRGYHKMEPEEVKDVVPPSRESIQSLLPLTCPHADCEAYRDDAFKTLSWKDQTEKRPFQKQADYNKHMREIHKESAFSCSVAGCERVGVKGYMREKDLMKHFADKHPEAPSYSYVPPKPRKYRCAGCGLELNSLQALQYHEAAICPARRTIYASNLPITTTS
ncbi:hypothetical protein F5X98DRAFT_319519 [Xylaria grammica]|nr:hypothetical protein F5X98DRAFT_319519 [Xylaria grammica]